MQTEHLSMTWKTLLIYLASAKIEIHISVDISLICTDNAYRITFSVRTLVVLYQILYIRLMITNDNDVVVYDNFISVNCDKFIGQIHSNLKRTVMDTIG